MAFGGEMSTKILNTAVDVKNRLSTLGLEKEDIIATVIAGEVARDNCSVLHPIMFAGYSAYANRVRILREKLIPKGWSGENVLGLELVVNHKTNKALAVCTGSDSTGDYEAELESKYPKGVATKKIIENNQLGFDSSILNIEKYLAIDPSKLETWYLMIHRDGDMVMFELCLPTKLDDENKISSAKERIIFDSLKLDDMHQNDFDSGETEESFDDFVVEVTKKE